MNKLRCVDVSHVIESGMITYRGFPAPLICDYLSREDSRARYEEGTEFQIGRIEMVANTGTYIDSPFHRYAHGLDIAQLPLERLVNLECIVIRIERSQQSIGAEAITEVDVAGKAVLIHTGWDSNWRTDQYFEGHPHLTEECAIALRDSGALLVGIDSLNIDSTKTGARPVHTTLLGADIPIVEHLCNLRDVPTTGASFNAAPVAVSRMGSFPVRAYAVIGS